MISPRGNTSTWLDPRHDVLAPPVGLPHPIITCPGPRAYVKRERPTPRAQKEKTHSSVSANTSAIPVSLIGRLQSPLSHRLHLRRRIRSSRPHRLFHSSYSPKRFLPPSIIWSDPPISLPQVGRSVGRPSGSLLSGAAGGCGPEKWRHRRGWSRCWARSSSRGATCTGTLRGVNATCTASTAMPAPSASTAALPATRTTTSYRWAPSLKRARLYSPLQFEYCRFWNRSFLRYGGHPTTTWCGWRRYSRRWTSGGSRRMSSTARGSSSWTSDPSPRRRRRRRRGQGPGIAEEAEGPEEEEELLTTTTTTATPVKSAAGASWSRSGSVRSAVRLASSPLNITHSSRCRRDDTFDDDINVDLVTIQSQCISIIIIIIIHHDPTLPSSTSPSSTKLYCLCLNPHNVLYYKSRSPFSNQT